MNVLGIESSCDDTAVAIYNGERGLLAHKMHSQVALHNQYGGVVPEIASRDHQRHLLKLLKLTLDEGDCQPSDIDAIAYTAGPGLMGALLVGACFGRSLAYAWDVPCVAVNHLEAHILACMLEDDKPEFPFLALLVSGGHTLLYAVKGLGDYDLLGETLDDAAGEAFDKTAKLMGLPYPGGPQIAKVAQRGRPDVFQLPRPMVNRPGLDFSFSGLKTHTRNEWLASAQDEQAQADLALAFQEAVVDTLAIKLKRALVQTGLTRCVLAGGVGANQALRERLQRLAEKQRVEIYYPRMEFCTDNGAMAAYAGYCHFMEGARESLSIKVQARWPLD